MDSVPNDRDIGETGCPALLPQHLDDLRASGLSDAQVRAAGVYSEPDPGAVAALLGWKHPAPALGPCLCFPFLDPSGAPVGHVMVKPDHPRQKNGKAIKYESPLGKPLRAYFPPSTRAALTDSLAPLLVTEGMKKAIKADQDGFPCVGLAGVYGWCRKRTVGPDGKKTGARELIPDLAAVAWRGRAVTIAFDSDRATNPDVARAERHLAEALTAVGAIVRGARLPGAPHGAKVGLDDFLVAHGPDALRALIEGARATTDATATKDEGTKPPSAADVLTAIGLELELWHDPTRSAFASAGPHSHAVRSKGFRHLLVHTYRARTGKVPNAEALSAALAGIEAAALFDGPERAAHVRLAGHAGRAYLHLANDTGTVIEIDGDGWRACPDPPVRFRKPAGMLPLPDPEPGGALDRLREFLNVPDASGFALVLAWLTGCFRPDGPFPALVLLGEQGSAKTTTGRVVKRLIDPSAAPVRSEPKEARDLMIHARNAWVLGFDNLSGLPGWLSDALCRLATGGGFSTRELYTNDDETIFDAKRPLVVNGIEDFITRADLLERSVLLRHPPIPEDKRRPESEFWAAFEAAHPKLLGALLDRVSAGLRELPRVKLDRLPRMADFALFAVACERGTGEPDRFLGAYADNQAGAHEQALDASPLPGALVALMDGRTSWEGTPAELFADLSRFAPVPVPKDWPKKPNVMTNKLRRLAPNLRKVHGLCVEDGRASGGASGGKRSRFVHVTRAPESGRETPSPASPIDPARAGARDSQRSRGDDPGGRYDPPSPDTVPVDRPRENAQDYGTSRAHGDAGDAGDDVSRPPSGRRYRNNDTPHEAR
ncbi:DUF3854 domain-containing protein [Gemmata sp. G18]|uniref:DUF3854 domain-containing protein n=1 Tax=Gemmata palustris TaxID=2822762 RepID=A0ABS5BL63_9BACT|nr:DUF3854 domain-containing protein [Gemmata palustris]MBP3954434.1 DUF3854 domain-containing protein [Gemmata palustris]